MNILHTADWHFGKQLYGQSLNDEMRLFLQWLYNTIQDQLIDVLLISGDIFDRTNPANEDKKMYFNFLKVIRELKTTTIITGGNHDSVNHLNAARNYLEIDNIHIIGGATELLEEEIIHLNCNNEELVVCAVPFLRDRDLRHQNTEHQFNSRQEAIQVGIEQHYQDLLTLAKKKYPNLPIVSMGHLFAVGSSTSDSERDIHIGNEGSIHARIFNGYDYVALGHIHKPQMVQKSEMIRYSGSPIPLSFSEKKDEKQVLIFSVEDGKVNAPKSILIPKNRQLLRFSGTLNEVRKKFEQFQQPEDELPTFIELHIKEEQHSIETIQETLAHIEAFNASQIAQIIHHQFSFQTGSKNLTELYEEGTSIEDLTINEVFLKRIESNLPDASEEQINQLTNTFAELIDLLQNDND